VWSWCFWVFDDAEGFWERAVEEVGEGKKMVLKFHSFRGKGDFYVMFCFGLTLASAVNRDHEHDG
jgi:hypothetical protein